MQRDKAEWANFHFSFFIEKNFHRFNWRGPLWVRCCKMYFAQFGHFAPFFAQLGPFWAIFAQFGPFSPNLGYSRPSNVVVSIQLTAKYRFCWRLDSNCGPLVLEATTLPPEPHPIPCFKTIFDLTDLYWYIARQTSREIHWPSCTCKGFLNLISVCEMLDITQVICITQMIQLGLMEDISLSLSLTSWPEVSSTCSAVVCTQEVNKRLMFKYWSIIAITTNK